MAQKKINILETINTNPFALRHLEDNIRNDKKIVLNVLKQNPLAFKFAGDIIKSDMQFILDNLPTYPQIVMFADNELLCDNNFMTKAIAIVDKYYKDKISKSENDKLVGIMEEYAKVVNTTINKSLYLLKHRIF